MNEPSEDHAVFEAVFHTAVDAIITIDSRGVIRSVNRATEDMFGYQIAELCGNNVSMLMPSPDREQHDQYLANYHSTGHAKIIGSGREVMARKKSGAVFPVHLAVSEVRSGGQKLYAGIIRDISDLKEAQAELIRFNDQLERMVKERTLQLHQAHAELLRKERLATLGNVSGSIAHEIRNSLNTIKTSAYYLLNAKQIPLEKSLEHLKRIDRQVTQIDQVITALTDVARLPVPSKQAVNVCQHLRQTVTSVRLEANIQVEYVFPEADLVAFYDRAQVELAWKNLVRNARDAMPDGGRLRVFADCVGGNIEVSVNDSGVGIAQEDLPNITEPLFTTKARGMGLGLSITKSIVQTNGGQLQVDSQPAQGSTFTVVFPVYHESSENG